MSINSISNKIVISQEEQSAVRNVTADSKVTTQKAEEEKEAREQLDQQVYGDVIGSSKDGDTVNAKKESLEALDTGMVFKKEENISLTGKTEDQLEVLYQQGKISKNDYDREEERRAAIKGEDPNDSKAKEILDEENEAAKEKDSEAINSTEQQNTKNAETLGKLVGLENEGKIVFDAIENADKADRMAIIEDIFNTNK